MPQNLEKECYLCGITLKFNSTNKLALKLKLPRTDHTHDPSAKSEAHYAHQTSKGRGRKHFKDLKPSVWKALGVENPYGSKSMCYECHEVVLHNPVFNERQLEILKEIFKDLRTLEAKLTALNQILDAGLEAYKSKRSPN
jgi:hypothetical protein